MHRSTIHNNQVRSISKQASQNMKYKAEISDEFVVLIVNLWNKMCKLINLFVIKLFEEHVPFLLQMGRHKASLLLSASSCPSTNCKLVVSKTKPNHSSVTMSLCDVTMDGEFFVQRAHC